MRYEVSVQDKTVGGSLQTDDLELARRLVGVLAESTKKEAVVYDLREGSIIASSND